MTEAAIHHYASDGIVARVLDAAGAADATANGAIAPERLYPFDQLHGRELLATKDHIARLAPTPGEHVLDIGCGIGGPARYIARQTGARVTGIDLTPDFVEAANILTALTGLADRVTVQRGDATALPFVDAEFDAAICFYVGMNLPDKRNVLSEACRVLRPGGRLMWTEAVLTGTGDPTYPLPWATTADGSFQVTGEELAGMIASAGFAVAAVIDETATHVELARERMQSGEVPPLALIQVNSVVLGPDFNVRRKNYIDSLAAGRIASLLIEATKPAG